MKRDSEDVRDKPHFKSKQRAPDQIQQQYDQLCAELASTKKYYQEFRRKVADIDVEAMVTDERSFCFFSNDQSVDSINASNIERDQLEEMKKYKKVHPTDVDILKNLKLKICEYLLDAERQR